MRSISLIIVVCVAAALSCTESPVEPVTFQGYKFYFWDEGDYKRYYSYDPIDDKLEPFWLPYRSIRAKVSPDGESMWTLTRDGSAVVMDIAEQEVTCMFESDNYLEIVFSDDGRYAALLGYELAIINLSDHSIMYSDTISCSGGQFSQNGNGFYYLSDGLFRLAIDDAFSKTRYDLEAHVTKQVSRVLPTADESCLYLVFRGGMGDLLAKYIPATDSLEQINYLFPACHQLALINNEQLLLATTLAPEISQMGSPEFAFQVFDTETNEAIWEQSVLMEILPGDTSYAAPTDLVITPDDRWAVMLMRSYEGVFVTVDLETMTVGRGYHLGAGHQFVNLSGSTIRHQ